MVNTKHLFSLITVFTCKLNLPFLSWYFNSYAPNYKLFCKIHIQFCCILYRRYTWGQRLQWNQFMKWHLWRGCRGMVFLIWNFSLHSQASENQTCKIKNWMKEYGYSRNIWELFQALISILNIFVIHMLRDDHIQQLIHNSCCLLYLPAYFICRGVQKKRS